MHKILWGFLSISVSIDKDLPWTDIFWFRIVGCGIFFPNKIATPPLCSAVGAKRDVALVSANHSVFICWICSSLIFVSVRRAISIFCSIRN